MWARLSLTGVLIGLGVVTLAVALGLLFLVLIGGANGIQDFINEL